jgi:SAM-dependent methyltransferase
MIESELQARIFDSLDMPRINDLCRRYEAAGMSARSGIKFLYPEKQVLRKIRWCVKDLDLITPPVKAILDIGTGAGWLPYIARFLGHTVYLSDAPNVKKYTEILSILGLSLTYKFSVTRQERMPLDGLSVDIITATGTAFHTGWDEGDWRFWLADCADHLKPGGQLFMVLNNSGLPVFRAISSKSWWVGDQTVIIPKDELR